MYPDTALLNKIQKTAAAGRLTKFSSRSIQNWTSGIDLLHSAQIR
eukprot:SAG31_NODE_7474_length_1680_cov_2.075269_2_plen_45_part_00